jgi:hypothetical protein
MMMKVVGQGTVGCLQFHLQASEVKQHLQQQLKL